MFKRILIANRGEIALRIIRTCREMGIETVAVFSKADENSLHTQLATRAVCIGSNLPKDSYLNMQNIISAAIYTQCDAIHPGFGFLSENAQFAKLCKEAKIAFIGPSSEIIEKMGNKQQARKLMLQNDVPIVPGSEGNVESVEQARHCAEKIGYPILIKASAGGGGKGMRRVFNKEELPELFNLAKSEARSCFGDDSMYIEKLIINPKHIEFQIMADNFGNVVHLGERDCSVQRKNQKLMEESPSKLLSSDMRERMGKAAVKAARCSDYTSVGTVEFVVDKEGNFYFIEMNTRIQVEHPVTEMMVGLDLIKEQIKIAAGLPLSVSQKDVAFNGHSIECRICAENPLNNFSPSSGKLNFIHFPGGNGVRIDSGVYQGYELPPYYDSMVAKIIVNAPTRLEAIKKMRRALEETIIEGIDTNIELMHLILYRPEIIKGDYDTGFIENSLDEMLKLI